MNHILTIDKCRGPALCHTCEAIAPGLYGEVLAKGSVVIKPWAMMEMSPRISRLARECPDRAIMVRPE
jgi:ferredoxin